MSPILLLPVLLLSLLAGCSDFRFGPHRIDVQQGNALDEEALARLKPGLNRSQVRFLLGTPLLVDPFRNDRWDYVYVFHRAGRLAEQKGVALFFDGDLLVRVEGDLPPAATEAFAAVQAVAPEVVVPATAPADEAALKAETAQPAAPGLAPTPVPQPAPKPEEAVLAALHGWADDWSRRDTQAYFAWYADDYRPQKGSRAEWEKRRRQVIGQAKLIGVTIESPAVEMLADGRAVVSFKQHYRSDTYQDAVRKQLQMVERDGRWLIVDERVLSNVGGKQP